MTEALKHIIKRHKELNGPAYINVFAGDDKKKDRPRETFKDLNKISLKDLQEEFEIYNIGSYGVFMNFNSLNKSRRIKPNVKKILYIFIDLDDAKEDHNEIIKTTLSKMNITYSYNSQSGHGYHFLVPIELESTDESDNKVRGFLNYLKNNYCEKVDLAVSTRQSLIRFPESLHNKDDESKKLITFHTHYPTKQEIEKNSETILKYQLEEKKGKKDIQYQNSIKKEDIFFTTILSNKNKWKEYIELLNSAVGRNPNFIKNLGFFIHHHPKMINEAEAFLSNWEKSRILAMRGWAKKAKEHNTQILYFELLKWSKDNNLKIFTDILIEQTKSSFLDEYEIYYLEDEKKESAYLLYYPEKNYYVQKSLQEVLQTIYYDSREKGIDLIKEFNLDGWDKWKELCFKKQLATIFSTIHQTLEDQRRIKLVYNINYEPTDSKFVYYNKKKFFNTYTNTSFWLYKHESKKYHFPNIKELLMNLVNNKKESYEYFNNWLGWIIQNPTEKLPTAIIFQGRQGSGKGTFKTHILDNIFGENCQEINQTHLESPFNEYLLGKQIIVANEVMHNENRMTLPNVLKNLVTDPEITISRKFRKEINGKNFTHWIFCTNSDNPIRIEEDDRRYSVFYSEKLKGGGKAAAKFVKELQTNIEFELKEYISYLKSLKINYEDVHEPIMTEAKQEIIELNKDSVEKFREYLLQFTSLVEAFTAIEGHLNNYSIDETFGDGNKYILTEKVYLLYERWCETHKERGIFSKQNFSKRLSNKGCKSIPKWKENRTFRMYNLQDINKLMEA